MAEEVLEAVASPTEDRVPYFWEVPNNGFVPLEGIFSSAKVIRTSDSGFDSYVSREYGFTDDEQEVVEAANKQADIIRPFIYKLVHDRKSMQAMMRAQDEHTFDFVGVLGVPKDQEKRMRDLMESGMDSALLPLLWIKEADSEFASTLGGRILLDSVTYDQASHDQFSELLHNNDLWEQANTVAPLKGAPATAVEKFINQTLTVYQQEHGTMDTEQERQARTELRNFFTSETEPYSPGLVDFREDFKKITADMYGEHLGGMTTFKGFSFRQDKFLKPDFYVNFSTLQRNAFNREKITYFRSIAEQAETGIRDALPDIYEPNLVEHFYILPPDQKRLDNAEYKDQVIYLTPQTRIPDVVDFRDLGAEQSEFWDNVTIKRRVADTIAFIHEWAHARREQVDLKSSRISKFNEKSATGAIEEGFAVMVEYLAIKHAIADPTTFGLEESDREDLIKARKGRTANLKESLSHYTEGVLHLLGRAYGEGVKDEHTEAGGIRAMLRFVDQIDMAKASALMRSMDEYKQIIDSRKPIDEIVQIINSTPITKTK